MSGLFGQWVGKVKRNRVVDSEFEDVDTQIEVRPRATGKARIDFPLTQEELPPTALQCYAVLNMPELGSTTVYFGRALTIGRAPDNDVCIRQDSKVSRYHSRIFRHGRYFYVQDMGSKNGTVVNHSLWARKRITGGETIWLGDTAIEVEHLGINNGYPQKTKA